MSAPIVDPTILSIIDATNIIKHEYANRIPHICQNVKPKLQFIDEELNTMFFPIWEAGYNKRFITLLSACRDTASGIAPYAKLFGQFLPWFTGPDALTDAQSIQLLDLFKQQTQTFGTMAQNTMGSFRPFSNDLGDFSTSLQTSAQQHERSGSSTNNTDPLIKSIVTTDVPNIRTCLDTFSNLWAAIVSALQSILLWIQNGENDLDIPPVLATFLTKVNTLYQGLSDALGLYLSAINAFLAAFGN